MGQAWGCRPLKRRGPWPAHPHPPPQHRRTPVSQGPAPISVHRYSNHKGKAARNREFLRVLVSALGLGQAFLERNHAERRRSAHLDGAEMAPRDRVSPCNCQELPLILVYLLDKQHQLKQFAQGFYRYVNRQPNVTRKAERETGCKQERDE